jgi:hypothetical protein
MKKLLLILLFIPLVSFGQEKTLSEYSDLMDSYYSSQPNLAIETFEKVVAEFSEKDIMVYSGLINKATVAYTQLIAIQLGQEKVWKELKGTSLKLIEHIEKWKIPDPTILKIAHESFIKGSISEGFKDGTDLNSFEKLCESYFISKELGQVYVEEDNKILNKYCNIFVLEENLEKSKLYIEIYKKGKKDKVDEDLTGILNLAVAYNKNSLEALGFLSYYLIEKIQKGLVDEDLLINKKIEKIKSINEQLTNNVDSKEAQYAGNFLNATLYSTILMTDMVKSTKDLSKSERIKIRSNLQKKMKESNEYKSSIFFFNEALKIVPKDFTLINSKAQIENLVGDYENACEDWKTLKEILEKRGVKPGNIFYDDIIDNINEHCNQNVILPSEFTYESYITKARSIMDNPTKGYKIVDDGVKIKEVLSLCEKAIKLDSERFEAFFIRATLNNVILQWKLNNDIEKSNNFSFLTFKQQKELVVNLKLQKKYKIELESIDSDFTKVKDLNPNMLKSVLKLETMTLFLSGKLWEACGNMLILSNMSTKNSPDYNLAVEFTNKYCN